MANDSHEIWLCEDCTHASAGLDLTITDERQARAVELGLTRLAERGWVVRAYDLDEDSTACGEGYDEHSHRRCGCCETTLGGARYRHEIRP